MKILLDSTPETMYGLAGEGFSGGSQVYAKAIIRGLVGAGHEVHVIANDLKTDERRGPTEWWWPPEYHPHKADVVIMQMHVRMDPPYEAPIAILMTSCVDPFLGPNNEWGDYLDGVPVFSQVHRTLLLKTRPGIPENRCFLTGLGVDVDDYYQTKLGAYVRPGRMLFGNDPARGLFYALDVFDLVKKKVPEATLHVTYDFARQFQYRCWEHSQMAEYLWECKRRLAGTPGVVDLGGLDRAGVIREQLECQVHCMPSDPPGLGTQTHGIM